ncbi:MAG: DUF3592 domain-containing protein [Gemmobacter sp.]
MWKATMAGDLLIVPGLALLAWGGMQILRERAAVARALDWPMVAGVVAGTRIDTGNVRSKYGAGWVYRPVLRYRYVVDGTDHAGDDAWLGFEPRVQTTEEAEAFLQGYAKGGAVLVRHDPDDPARSAVFVGADPLRGLEFVLPGLVMLVFGVLLHIGLRQPVRPGQGVSRPM